MLYIKADCPFDFLLYGEERDLAFGTSLGGASFGLATSGTPLGRSDRPKETDTRHHAYTYAYRLAISFWSEWVGQFVVLSVVMK